MKKLIRFFAYTILFLALLSIYSSMVRHATRGGSLGPLTRPVNSLAQFPSLVQKTFKQTKEERRTMKRLEADFESINNLKEDVKVLRSYTTESGGREVVIQNLRNDEILRTWALPDTFEDHDRVKNPIAMPNGDLIYHIIPKSGLKRVDKDGNYVWQAEQTMMGHHSLNLDHEGNVWGCATRKINGKLKPLAFNSFKTKDPVRYRDDEVLKWDAETGEIIFQKSLTELMLDHDLTYLLFQQASSLKDPFHLNDVEPILADSGYFKQGEILLSIRNSHTILHYRPSNDSVIKVIRGPFTFQHDVDFVDGHTIAISNNNMHHRFLKQDKSPPTFGKADSAVFSLTNSNVILYDYDTDSFSSVYENQFTKHRITTKTEGLYTFLKNGDLFYEQQNRGVLWIFNDSAVVYKHMFPAYLEGFRDHLNWTRVVE